MASVQVSVQIVRRLCRLCADSVEAEAVQGVQVSAYGSQGQLLHGALQRSKQ